MQFITNFALLSLLLVATSTSLVNARRTRICASNGLKNAVDEDALARMVDEYVEENDNDDARRAFKIRNIDVHFHSITSSGRGNVSDATVQAQINTLNQDYASTGYHFNLASSESVEHSGWFSMAETTKRETAMKTQLRKGSKKDLNLYSADLGPEILGRSTWPWDYRSQPHMDGVLIHFDSMPGGDAAPFNLGRTASHEIGHWLGLYHPFQGLSCVGKGDYVKDTPRQSQPTLGCPATKNTCSGGGSDGVHNIMDYSDDACLNQFTPGQIKRMHALTKQFRNL